MLQRLFPTRIDNIYRGQWIGFWLLAPVLLLKIAIALGSILTPANASGADGIDISSFSPAALRDAASSSALLGWLHLCIAMVGVLAMARYRAMVPMIYIWLLVEFLGRRVILNQYPIDRVASPPPASIINLVLLTIMGLGLCLSLWPRRRADLSADAGV